VSEGPPTYEWSFSDVHEGETAGVWVRPSDHDYPTAAFTPDLDAYRSWGNVEFSQVSGPQIQSLTIEMTPQEVMELLLIIVVADDNPMIPFDEDDLVEAVIVSFPDGGDVSPDGHFLAMGFRTPDVGAPISTTITIQVTPNVPRVEYKPVVWVIAADVIDYDIDVPLGNSHSLYVDPLGTWTWNADGEYRLTSTESIWKAVTFTGVSQEPPPTDVHTWPFCAAGFFPQHLPDSYTEQVVLADLDPGTIPGEVQGVYRYDCNAMEWKFWAPGAPGTTLTTLGGGHTYDYMVAVTGDCDWNIPLP